MKDLRQGIWGCELAPLPHGSLAAEGSRTGTRFCCVSYGRAGHSHPEQHMRDRCPLIVVSGNRSASRIRLDRDRCPTAVPDRQFAKIGRWTSIRDARGSSVGWMKSFSSAATCIE